MTASSGFFRMGTCTANRRMHTVGRFTAAKHSHIVGKVATREETKTKTHVACMFSIHEFQLPRKSFPLLSAPGSSLWASPRAVAPHLRVARATVPGAFLKPCFKTCTSHAPRHNPSNPAGPKLPRAVARSSLHLFPPWVHGLSWVGTRAERPGTVPRNTVDLVPLANAGESRFVKDGPAEPRRRMNEFQGRAVPRPYAGPRCSSCGHFVRSDCMTNFRPAR